MDLDFNKIVRLQKLRREKENLHKEEHSLTTPMLTDRSLIGEIYKQFLHQLSQRDCSPHPASVIQRKKFIFIILYLYSPSSLAGGKLLNGLREELSRVLGIPSQSTISDNCADVVFLYQTYSEFSKDVESLYASLINSLKINQLID